MSIVSGAGAVTPLSTLLLNGKHSNFSNSFNRSMYQDTRINSIKVRTNREMAQKQRLESKEKVTKEVRLSALLKCFIL